MILTVSEPVYLREFGAEIDWRRIRASQPHSRLTWTPIHSAKKCEGCNRSLEHYCTLLSLVNVGSEGDNGPGPQVEGIERHHPAL